MTINYDRYTTNFRHGAAHATLIVKATIYNKPFTFNLVLKNLLTLFFKFPGQFHYFRDKVSKSGTVPDNPGRMACMTSFDFNCLCKQYTS